MYGELLPVGGGDPIPLLKTSLIVGRRESADIVLRFPNVSSHHCELTVTDGYWVIKDLRSSNGIKVNGERVTEKLLKPHDRLAIAKHEFEIVYEPARLGATEAPPETSTGERIFGKSLLEEAGLESRRSSRPSGDQRRHSL
jgi:adenylate cyclase